MSCHSGANIIKDGLVFVYDVNSALINRKNTNLLAQYPWSLGSGTNSGYYHNGDGNQRIIDQTPFGTYDIIWETINNDVASNADGGWNGSIYLPIDPTKLYRFSVWIQRKVVGNGTTYLGLYGYDSSNTNIGVLNASNGAVNTNPYFEAENWGYGTNTWVLYVGHVHPANTSVGTLHPDTGKYYTDGTKIATIGDFIWQTSNTQTIHRSYLYYSTEPTTHQQWYSPRIDICDGNEPSISELLNMVDYDRDLIGYSDVNNYGAVKNPDLGYFSFAGTGERDTEPVGEYITLNSDIFSTDPLLKPNGVTYNVWLRFTGNQSTGHGIFVGSTTINHLEYRGSDTETGFWRTEAVTQNGYSFGATTNTLDGGHPLNEWFCLTLVFANNEVNRPVYWYRDGELFYTGNMTSGTNPDTEYFSPSYFGKSTGSDGYLYAESFKGDMGHLSCYERSLSPEEVKQNFNALRGRFGI